MILIGVLKLIWSHRALWLKYAPTASATSSPMTGATWNPELSVHLQTDAVHSEQADRNGGRSKAAEDHYRLAFLRGDWINGFIVISFSAGSLTEC
jgi:hypothetical protein